MPGSRRIVTIAALALTAALLSACAAESPGAAPTPPSGGAATKTVASAYGDVEVPTDPQRVAAVSYDTPWQLMSVDVVPIATIDYSRWIADYSADQQDFIADAAMIGTYGEINFEALTAATPDLIIGDAFEVDEATFTRLQTIAPTVIVGGDDRGDWQSITEQTAEATGTLEVWAEGKAAYEQLRDETKATYADVIAAHTWINFSFGDDTGQFSVQLPSGSTGNLVVEEMGMQYGAGAQLDDPDGRGYASRPLEQLPTVFEDVTFALTFATQDGQIHSGIRDIIDTEIFQTLAVAKDDAIYGMTTTVTDYRTARDWIVELTENVLEPLSS